MARVTAPALQKMKADGVPITMVTAYDYPSALLVEAAGIDVVLVGDSLGNVVQGEETTLPVTLEQSLYHARLVSKACRHAMVIGDMPFGTYMESDEQAVRNGTRYLKEAGTQAVKLEGGVRAASAIAALVRAQVPVQGHIGLTPQSVHTFGGFRIQRERERLLEDAKRVEDAGAFSVVLEGLPGEIAAEITDSLAIPTIGIGAGVACSGQVLVWHDMLGLYRDQKMPKFVRQYAQLADTIVDALTAYRDEVRDRTFPTDTHTYDK